MWWSSPVVTAFLWATAVAAMVWMLVPAIAFALGKGWVRTSVLPDAGPPTMHGHDSAFAARLRELDALGFQIAGRTRQHALFMTPTHWRWRSYQPAQWVRSADGRTFAALYRLVPDEPARISLITLFDGGGLVRTACPGPLPTEGLPDNYRLLAIRGLDAAALLARHTERIGEYEADRGARARAATIAEIAALDDPLSWSVLRKIGRAEYPFLFLLLGALSGIFLPLAIARRHVPSSLAALFICALAGLVALTRWLARGPLLRYNARRAHTEDIATRKEQKPPDDVAEDGTILATGKNEHRLRKLAAVAAMLVSVWPIFFAWNLPFFAARGGAPAAVFSFVLIALGATVVAALISRARGRIWYGKRGRRDPANVWFVWMVLNLLFMSGFQNRGGARFAALLVVGALSATLAVVGMQLEKKRGK